MPKRNAKGRFVKGGHSHHAHHARSTGGAMVIVEKRAPQKRRASSHKVKHHKRRGGKRGGRMGGGMNLTHLAIAGAGLAFLTGDSAPIAQVTTLVDKIPGSKTFGRTATAGLACLAVDRFVKRNRWLRAAGVIGVVLAAAQVGAKGKDFKWLGDEGGPASGDEEFSGDVDGDDVGDEGDE